MADRLHLPRAENAGGTTVSDAVAYFYAAGTSTPLTVYEDDDLTTARGTTVAADADGVFPACWVASGTEVKIDVEDGDGVSLPGYPNDQSGRFPQGGQDAANIVHTPQTGNTATDVQGALNNNTEALNRVREVSRPVITTGSGGAYAIAANITVTAYTVGMAFTFVANHNAVGSGTDTLNVDGVGAVQLKKRFGSTTKFNLSSMDIRTGDTVTVAYDGTDFVVLNVMTGDEFRFTTQGQIIYRGSANSTRLNIGSAGQVLKVNSGANAPEWTGLLTSFEFAKPGHVNIGGFIVNWGETEVAAGATEVVTLDEAFPTAALGALAGPTATNTTATSSQMISASASTTQITVTSADDATRTVTWIAWGY